MGNFFDQFDPPSGTVGPAPNVLPSAQSAPVGPTPPGAVPLTWREETTKGSATNSNDALAQAEGAMESLQHLQHLRGLVSQAPDEAFGPLAGSNFARYFNSAAGSMLPAGGVPHFGAGSPSLNPADLASWHERLNAAYNGASLPMIKQLFGAVPRSPEMQNKALEVLGGTTTSDKATALQLIDAAAADAYGKINRGIAAGRVPPGAAQQSLRSGAMPAGNYTWDPTKGLAPK